MAEKFYAIKIRNEVVIDVSSYEKTFEELKEKVDEYNGEGNNSKYIIAEDEILKKVCAFKVSKKELYKDSVKDFRDRISMCEQELYDLCREIKNLED